jgi:hypothetical protein
MLKLPVLLVAGTVIDAGTPGGSATTSELPPVA